MNRTDFLSSLNEEQRKAVEKIQGAVLVLAGPGTGKTHLLASRIAHILQSTDADPSNILCLTFTESAATEMRNRLQTVIGTDAYRVKIFTFHGFCEWVMTENPEVFRTRRGSREVSDDLQKALAFRDTIREGKWKYFSDVWDEFQSRRKVLSAISKLKRENISPESFRQLVPEEKKRMESDPENIYKRKFKTFKPGDFKPSAFEKISRNIGKMEELADFWELFEKKMKERNKFDFDDQLMWGVNELQENKDLKLDLQEKFQWILVDEYQDTNSAQNEILWQLTDFDDDPNLFAVGDDDQAIYRFQGASVENVQEFKSRFPKCLLVTLSENYRSAPNILEVSTSVVSKNIHRVDPDKTLTSSGENKKFTGNITRAVFGSRYTEIGFLVERIREELREGITPSEIAILVRKNAEVEEIARQLPKFGIPVSAQIFQNIFDDEQVRTLILLLRIFANPDNDEKLFELLHAPFWEIAPEKLLRWSHDRKEKKISAFEFLFAAAEKEPELARILHVIATSRKDFSHCRPEVLTEKLLYESGLAKHVSRPENKNSAENWAKLHKFLGIIRDQKCDTLEEALDRIDLYLSLHIPVRPEILPSDHRAVQIMTAHKAKGKEFDVVFIPGLLDHVWGNTKGENAIPLPQLFSDAHDGNDEERRLFFVALTRARKKIFLSYSTTDFSGREKTPSQFWHEVPEKSVHDLPLDDTEEQVQKLLPVFLQESGKTLLTDGEKEILREKAKKFVWSATSLQTFLDCPRKFLYQNLYHLPRNPTLNMSWGIAVHEALEKFGRRFTETKKLPPRELLLEEFEKALRGQSFGKAEFEKMLAHGQEVLGNYFDVKKEMFTPDSLLEFNFKKFAPEVQGIRITGKMDRIEFLDAGKTRVRIIDYKSGKPRSIQKGDKFWRQLVFYDLLVRHSKGIPWHAEEFALEFLTPDSKGKLEQKKLDATEEDRAQVVAELLRANTALQNLEFPIVQNPENKSDIDFWQHFGQ